jgi:hypothetical protein
VPAATAPVLTLREIGHGYRLGGSLAASVCLHGSALLLFILLGHHALLPPLIVVKPDLASARRLDPLMLPALGGGSDGGGKSGGGSGASRRPSTSLEARSRRGFAYPGPQPMVSNPPGAELGIVTLLQPSLDHLRRLKGFVELPNIVQPPPADPQLVPKQPPLVIKSGRLPVAKAMEAPAVVAPKLAVPTTSDSNLAGLLQPAPKLPRAAIPEAVAAPQASIHADTGMGLLVLNAIPPPPDVKANIPRAEQRSLFAVSPAEVTVIELPSGGSANAGSAPTPPGMGRVQGRPVGDAVAEMGSITGSSKSIDRGAGAGRGTGTGIGDLNGTGVNSGANEAGNGRGNESGTGVGSGPNGSHGTGMGVGSAPGHGGFPGITIQGGRYGNSANMVVKVQGPQHPGSYNMTIEATAGSGGGLPDLGIFRNEKVYTVYLDMRTNDSDRMPSWTLQYAVLGGDTDRPTAGMLVRKAPTPPYATLKAVPQFPPAIERKCARGLIVASAILGADGKLQDVSVQQTPEEQVTAPLLQALSTWIFEPAKIDGRPVALKVLFGIRLPAY